MSCQYRGFSLFIDSRNFWCASIIGSTHTAMYADTETHLRAGIDRHYLTPYEAKVGL